MDEYAELSETYDSVVRYRERDDVDFFVDCAKDAQGPVLELGCGTGRVLIPTARAGVTITGLDASKAMLEVCRESLRKEAEEVRERVTLMEGDMRAFNLEAKFALVTLPFRPFQHLLEVEDQMRCLRAVRAHLLDGGRLVLDLFNPMHERLGPSEELPEYEVEPEATMPDGRKMIRKGRIVGTDRSAQVIDVELRHEFTTEDGEETVQTLRFKMRYFFRYEVEHLLARCGFRVEALYGNYDGSPFGATYPGELLFVAEKA